MKNIPKLKKIPKRKIFQKEQYLKNKITQTMKHHKN